MKRKSVLLVMVLVIGSMSILSIAGMAEATPRYGGTLVVAEYWEPDTLDPQISDSRHTTIISDQIFDSLLYADKDGNLYPTLATSWEMSADGLHYTFELRKDVKFHDGTVFNAEAVKYNLDRLADPDTGSLMFLSQFPQYESTDVLGDYTVRINLKSRMGSFLFSLANRISIVSPTAAEKWGVKDFGFHPVGTGPFKFVEWIPQEEVVLEKNEDYNWGPASPAANHSGPAYLDKVIIKYVTESSTRSAVLDTGEADISIRVQEYDIKRFDSDPDFVVHKQMVAGTPTMFILNTNKPPLDDVRVRQALNKWLDRVLIVNTVFGGEFSPAYGVLSPSTFAYSAEAEKYYKMDRSQATQLLEEAGWVDTDGDGIRDKDGVPMEINIYSCGDYVEPPQAIQPQLKDLGMNAKIVMVPWTEQKKVCFTGTADMMVGTFNDTDPNVLRLLFHSENIGESGWNWTHLYQSDPALQETLDTLLENGDLTANVQDRAQIYQEVQKLIGENALALPIRVDDYNYVSTSHVHGWTTGMDNWIRTYNLWLDK